MLSPSFLRTPVHPPTPHPRPHPSSPRHCTQGDPTYQKIIIPCPSHPGPLYTSGLRKGHARKCTALLFLVRTFSSAAAAAAKVRCLGTAVRPRSLPSLSASRLRRGDLKSRVPCLGGVPSGDKGRAGCVSAVCTRRWRGRRWLWESTRRRRRSKQAQRRLMMEAAARSPVTPRPAADGSGRVSRAFRFGASFTRGVGTGGLEGGLLYMASNVEGDVGEMKWCAV